jgi:hypothetical protein
MKTPLDAHHYPVFVTLQLLWSAVAFAYPKAGYAIFFRHAALEGCRKSCLLR